MTTPPSGDPAETLDRKVERRQAWFAVLSRADGQDLTQAVDRARDVIGDLPEYRFLRRPEVGLMMMRGRAGGRGEPFNLGEMTVARCSILVSDGLANGLTGHAYRRGRDLQAAEKMALMDALLQADEHYAPLMDAVVHPLARSQAQSRAERLAESAETKVDFFTMMRER
ncbi:MAG: phosphonate C-P lyase system protein PhnG [Magnetovibrionaceae bacterium]